MDSIMMQKFQAIKKSKKCKKQQLLDKFFLYTFVAFTGSVICSSPFWFPYLCSSMKGFLFISLPKMSSILYSPKLLFLVGNLIVVLLIGESRFLASGSSLPGDAYYDEYVDRSRSLRNSSTLELKKEQKMKPSDQENLKWTCQVGGKVVSVRGRLVEEIKEVKRGKQALGGEHELILPTEELKKRADDFIARVNRQRKLEARLLLN
ncbi:uncharacterized protein LOC110418405 [Herrania umbratica]|uniref:Uncharacterized protein LOC110418405 n=1 Tax=Herrania umbratica TaxID=108875 RepID=A0A6J1AJN4_9ROSI|nr:uncharacterized protein LOC110418405 [Herrania umbratica]